MSDATNTRSNKPMLFDYLPKYEHILMEHFQFPDTIISENLTSDIARYRRIQRQDNGYRDSGLHMRLYLESAFKQICGYSHEKDMPEGTNLSSMIIDAGEGGRLAEDKDLNKRIRIVCDEIRTKANKAVHELPFGQTDLNQLIIGVDDFFRLTLVSMKIEDFEFANEVTPANDQPLIAHSDSLESKARIADQLTQENERLKEKNGRLEEEARRANESARKSEEKLQDSSKRVWQLTDRLSQAEQEKKSLAAENDRQLADRNQTIADRDQQIARKEQEIAQLRLQLSTAKSDQRKDERELELAAAKVDEIEQRIDQILEERDFIRQLLDGRGMATPEQLRAVNYPLDPRHRSKVIKLVGGAGTGKTLVMLAGIVKYLECNRQTSLPLPGSPSESKALFVCFNKNLAAYARAMLNEYPHLRDRIEFASYDEYINQLVRNSPKRGYEHLSAYANDVRYPAETDARSPKRYWTIAYAKKTDPCLRQAMDEVASNPDYCGVSYLKTGRPQNIMWMREEIAWLESRYTSLEEGHREYPQAERAGRGNWRLPPRNSIERRAILAVWTRYCELLKQEKNYTIAQATARLLRSNQLPSYDIIAIDESQDLSMNTISLLYRMKSDKGFLYIAGDEHQKLYQRDFTWRQVDETQNVRPHTIRLHTNMRNPEEVRRFAERLTGSDQTPFDAGDVARICRESVETTVEHIRLLATRHPEDSIVVISNQPYEWASRLEQIGLPVHCGEKKTSDSVQTDPTLPGIHVFPQFKMKGLEFDHVVVDYNKPVDSIDEHHERCIRYTQFTRARKTLYVRCDAEVPPLLQKCYPDFLEQ